MSTPTAEPGGNGAGFAVTPLGGCVRLQVTGELDLCNQDQLHSALAEMASDGITIVHLEMSGLEFVDIAGTRELVAFAMAHPQLRLILHNPPASLQRIIDLLDLLGPGTNIDIRYQQPHADSSSGRTPGARGA
jgi:anti-anti-sigma factor